MRMGAFAQVMRRYPGARRLWVSETIQAFGSFFFTIALMWYVFSRTGSGLDTGLVAVTAFIPQVTLGLWFGVLADRYARPRLMMLANGLSGLLAGALALAVALHVHAMWPVYGVTTLMGATSALYDPARAGIFPALIVSDDLLTAHALFHTSRQVARIVGSSLGGLVVAMVGAAPTMGLDFVTFLTAAALLARLPLAVPTRPAEPKAAASRPWHEMAVAWRWLRARPTLLVMSGIGMVSNVALGPVNVLPPMLIRDTFHQSAASLGPFDASIGLGVVAGGLVLGTLVINRMGLAQATALAAEGLGLLLVALAPSVMVADVGNLVLGIGLVTANAPGQAMAETLIPSDLLGRVSALFGTTAAFAIPITYGGVGIVGDAIGPQATYGLAAVLMGTCVVASLVVPGIRTFRLDEHRAAAPGVSAPVASLPD